MILQKFWSAFVAQINKVANLFWEADPVAQMRYEYDRAVDQLKEGRGGLEQYRGLVERVTRQAQANRSHVQKLEAETKAYLKAGDRDDRGQVRARAAEGQGAAGSERAAAANARNGVRQQPEEDSARERKADRAAREDPEVRRRAEDERGRGGDREAVGNVRHEPDDGFRRDRIASSSRRSIRIAARCAWRPICRSGASPRSRPKSACRGSSPKRRCAASRRSWAQVARRRRRCPRRPRTSGPPRRSKRTLTRRSGRISSFLQGLTYGKRTTQTGLLRCGAARRHRAGRPRDVAVRRDRRRRRDGADLERGAEADEGRRRGAGQLRDHHGQGIQVRGRREAAGRQGHLQLHADGEPHGAVRHQRLGGLGPDHLREQRLQARQGLEVAGRQGLQARARADRRSGRDARRVRRRQPSRRLGHARHDSAVPRRAAQGHARDAARVPAGRLVERRRRHRRSRHRSRRWRICGARRSCWRRTRRRISSC